VGGTVWEALVVRVALRPGESILIHGGAGGGGHVAIQLAKAPGAKVLTTVRAANFEFAQSRGADVLIDYQQQAYVQAVLRETGGRGVDVVFDTIGDDALSRSPELLAQLGRVVPIVDTKQPQNVIQAWGKNASYHVVFTRQNRGKLDELSALVERGQLEEENEKLKQLVADLSPDKRMRQDVQSKNVRSPFVHVFSRSCCPNRGSVEASRPSGIGQVDADVSQPPGTCRIYVLCVRRSMGDRRLS